MVDPEPIDATAEALWRYSAQRPDLLTHDVWIAQHPALKDAWRRQAITALTASGLLAENERLKAALNYISMPTMGWDGRDGKDHAAFAMDGATEQAVRTALRQCIWSASAALAPRGETDGD